MTIVEKDSSLYDKVYSEVLSEARQTFIEKSKKYNYSFFKNDLLTVWFDIRRKYDRLDVLIRENYCHGELPKEILNTIEEESEDLANYAIMFRVYLKVGERDGFKNRKI